GQDLRRWRDAVAPNGFFERGACAVVRLERDHPSAIADDGCGEHGEVADVGADVHEDVAGLERRDDCAGNARLVGRAVEKRMPAGRIRDVEPEPSPHDEDVTATLSAPAQPRQQPFLREPVETRKQPRPSCAGAAKPDEDRPAGWERGDQPGRRRGQPLPDPTQRARREARRAHAAAGSSVSTATSGGQLIRTGTYTVPTPRLTKIDVPSRRSNPAMTGN